MEPVNPLLEPYGARVEALVAAYDAADTAAFTRVLDQLLESRRPELLGDLREVTCNLQVAFERFRVDARLVDLAQKEIPDDVSAKLKELTVDPKTVSGDVKLNGAQAEPAK